jgi:hypothetical protein
MLRLYICILGFPYIAHTQSVLPQLCFINLRICVLRTYVDILNSDSLGLKPQPLQYSLYLLDHLLARRDEVWPQLLSSYTRRYSEQTS